jgi:hypothetical protein
MGYELNTGSGMDGVVLAWMMVTRNRMLTFEENQK